MLTPFRIFAAVALGLLALSGVASAGDTAAELLPAEPASGEWLEDTLNDDSLWFASSENLAFEAIAQELTGYPDGRRWVRVVDGKPAWVMYYVPGEILGFEVDTHHYGAAGTAFTFAAGETWNALAPIDVSFEEIVAFESKWLRLYRSADVLPPGTRFLRIEFPRDAEVDAARLTEVWLRCRFEAADENAPQGEPRATTSAATQSSEAGTETEESAPAPVAGEHSSDDVIAPFVVTTFVYHPEAPAAPRFPPVAVESAPPVVVLELPPHLDPADLIGELKALLEPPPEPEAPETPKPLLSRLVDFVREHVLR